MKTAEEYTKEYFNTTREELGEEVFDEMVAYIKTIQLDARKHGNQEVWKEFPEWFKQLIASFDKDADEQVGEGIVPMDHIIESALNKIKLDAWKQGMSDALKIVEGNNAIPNYSIFDISKAIHDKESI